MRGVLPAVHTDVSAFMQAISLVSRSNTSNSNHKSNTSKSNVYNPTSRVHETPPPVCTRRQGVVGAVVWADGFATGCPACPAVDAGKDGGRDRVYLGCMYVFFGAFPEAKVGFPRLEYGLGARMKSRREGTGQGTQLFLVLFLKPRLSSSWVYP